MKSLVRWLVSLLVALLGLGAAFMVVFTWPVQVGQVVAWMAIIGVVFTTIGLVTAGVHALFFRR